MKSLDERKALLMTSLAELGTIQPVAPLPTLCSVYNDDLSEFGFKKIIWAPHMWQGGAPLPKSHPLMAEHRVFSIGLSSVLACLQLTVEPGATLLDMCAAPGIKSAYLQVLHNNSLKVYVNDVSQARLLRLRKLFNELNLPLPVFSNQPGETLLHKYEPHSFDAVLIDAPCSGEGTILSGDESALATWSPAKVKRLSSLQRRLLITGKQLVKPGSSLVYATCTLNKRENELVLQKADAPVSVTRLQNPGPSTLQAGQAFRILPSHEGIGFFVAKIQ